MPHEGSMRGRQLRSRLPALPLLLCALAVATTANADVCSKTGEEAPTVVTLMASKTKPATEAWIVSPECKIKVAKLDATNTLTVAYKGIEQVTSVPTAAKQVDLTDPLSYGADFSNVARLDRLALGDPSANLFDNVVYPDSVGNFYVIGGDAQQVTFPSSCQGVYLGDTQIESLQDVEWPVGLRTIGIANSRLTALDFPLPDTLSILRVTGNRIAKLERVTFPSTVTYIDLNEVQMMEATGVRWPSSLTELYLGSAEMTAFEIRESDYTVFTKLYEFQMYDYVQTCDSPRDLVQVQSYNVCLLDDESFEKIYFPVATPAPTTEPPPTPSTQAPAPSTQLPALTTQPPSPTVTPATNATTDAPTPTTSPSPTTPVPTSRVNATTPSASSGSTSGSQDEAESLDDRIQNLFPPIGSARDTTSTGVANKPRTAGAAPASGGGRPGASSPTTNTNEEEHDDSEVSAGRGSRVSAAARGRRRSSGSGSGQGSSGSGATRQTSAPQTGSTLASDGATSSKTSLIVLVSVGMCCVVYLAGVVLKTAIVKKNQKDSTSTEMTGYTSLATPTTHPEMAPSGDEELIAIAGEPEKFLLNDVRNDEVMIPFRIRHGDVRLGNELSRGGFGVLYRGVYQGRDVAVKRMLSVTAQDEASAEAFMDEIRMCARLDHPKVVKFIGITWTSLRDTSVVIELMPGGDLHGVLQKQPASPNPQEWSSAWSPAKLKNKTSIAMDVTEAVVYLHSFDGPIIHRDLKARNVLLDAVGNAKLSDFGISREVAIGETMTSEVGTAAWIAPEVLRGERYSEKADIYSLGVLLVEMDRCRHPYAHDEALQAISPGRRKTDSGGHVTSKNTQIAVLVSTGQLRPTVSTKCPESIAAVAASCLRYDASERPTAMEVFYELRKARKSQLDGSAPAS